VADKRPILDVVGLRTSFFPPEGELKAVDGVSLALYEGEFVALVGESGCGKTLTALSIMGLAPAVGARVLGGHIEYVPADGGGGKVDLLSLSDREWRDIRGRDVAMIFQDPLTSLNPVLTVGEQIAEVLTTHNKTTRRDAMARAGDLLADVGVPNVRERLRAYPHQMSGGMRQRVMIAEALACGPRVLLADEPTTALDVTIQAQILDLIKKLQEKRGTTVLLITHDLGIVAETCSYILVMYAGRIVERAEAKEFFASPRHPYSQGLLKSVPRLDETASSLTPVEGQPPSLISTPKGCPFEPRCERRFGKCADEDPPEIPAGGAKVRCWLYEKRDEGKK